MVSSRASTPIMIVQSVLGGAEGGWGSVGFGDEQHRDIGWKSWVDVAVLWMWLWSWSVYGNWLWLEIRERNTMKFTSAPSLKIAVTRRVRSRAFQRILLGALLIRK